MQAHTRFLSLLKRLVARAVGSAAARKELLGL